MLRSFIRATLALSIAALAACASVPASPWNTMGAVNRLADGQFELYGLARSNDFSAVTYVVPSTCYGRELTLSAEYRTPNGISQGTLPFHGLHVDYELRRQGMTSHPTDYLTDASPNWRTVSRSWMIPVDASRVIARVGLQGVDGKMEVKNLRVSCQ